MRSRSDRSNSLLEVGLFLVVVASPLVFTPFTAEPFVDPKLWLLTAGALAVAAARPTVDGRIAIGALVFVAAIGVTTAVGVDPWWGLLSTEARGVGLVGLAASAILLCSATGLPDDLRARVPRWLFWTGVFTSVIAVVTRFVTIGTTAWSLDNFSGTMGHRTIVGGFVGAATVAATAFPIRWPERLGLLLLGSAISVTSARGGLVGVFVGLFVVVLTTRKTRVVLAVLLPFLIAFAGWTAGGRYLRDTSELGYSPASRLTQLNEGETRERPQAYKAFLRAYLAEPIMGSGPETAWEPFLTHARPAEIRVAGRGFADTHDILLEFGVTSGSVGLFTFLVLMTFVLARIRCAPADRLWAFGSAVAVGVVLSVEPFSLPLVPLLFLTAGLAVGSTEGSNRLAVPRWVAATMVLALALSSLDLVASSFERFGTTYASEPALRFASKLEPWRSDVLEALANERAFDYLAGDRSARRDAERLSTRNVRQHPWHPNTRLLAANVAVVVRDDRTAARWIREDLSLFPNDPLALEADATLTLRQGDRSAATELARKALALDPTLQVAARVLKDASSAH